jgi:hypothetical protein
LLIRTVVLVVHFVFFDGNDGSALRIDVYIDGASFTREAQLILVHHATIILIDFRVDDLTARKALEGHRASRAIADRCLGEQTWAVFLEDGDPGLDGGARSVLPGGAGSGCVVRAAGEQ